MGTMKGWKTRREKEAQRQAATAAAERAACAELVRAAGCSCDPEMLDGSRRGNDMEIEEHTRTCPQALATAIEARGRA